MRCSPCIFSAQPTLALSMECRGHCHRRRRQSHTQQRRIGRLLRDMCEVSSDEEDADPIGIVAEDCPFAVAFNVCAVEGGHDRLAAALAGGTVAEEIPLAGGAGPAMSHDDADDDAGPAAVAFDDHEGCVADGAAGAGDAEVEAVQRRIIKCVKCDKHHLVPPGYEQVYMAELLKFVCARLPGRECRPSLTSRAQGRGRRNSKGRGRGSRGAAGAEESFPGDSSVRLGAGTAVLPLAPAFGLSGKLPPSQGKRHKVTSNLLCVVCGGLGHSLETWPLVPAGFWSDAAPGEGLREAVFAAELSFPKSSAVVGACSADGGCLFTSIGMEALRL